MINKTFPLLIGMLLASTMHAQEQIPLIKGTVDISISKGTFDCNLAMQDIPYIDDYLILINSGMNMRNIKDTLYDATYYYQRTYQTDVSYESFGYYLNGSEGKFMRDVLLFNYTGKFPVIADTSDAAAADWKGNIAFNGYSIRADGLQCAWYPVLYDVKKDKYYEKVKYDIKINCSDCNTIYLNGNKPVPGSIAHLKSDVPMEMMLFAGRYKVKNVDGTFFLNPDITNSQMQEFGRLTNKIKDLYAAYLGIPYKYDITYINTTPVSRRHSWLFVSYPTIVNIGWGDHGLRGFFVPEKMDRRLGFIAHELGHYYFGAYRNYNSAIGDAITEGFAEYLSAQVIRHIYGTTGYRNLVDEWIENCTDFSPVSISAIAKEEDYKSRQAYVYNYMPLILTAVEKEIGMDAMWQWMKNILEGKTEFTDAAYLKRTLMNAISQRADRDRLYNKYFTGDSTLANALATIQHK